MAGGYLANMADNNTAAATLSKNRWLLEDITFSLSSRPEKEITSAEVLDLLKRAEKSGRRETARKLRGVISSVIQLAIVTLRADNDPTIALRGALKSPKTKGRAAIIDEAELGALLCTIDTYTGWPTVKGALKFPLLTCVRPDEVRGFDPDVIEAVLVHQYQNSMRCAYNRASYWDQRIELIQKWADLPDEFRELKK